MDKASASAKTPEPSPADRPQRFRILSLEGGGIMGAFSASALAAFEDETGQRCVDHFDLIAGTLPMGTSVAAIDDCRLIG